MHTTLLDINKTRKEFPCLKRGLVAYLVSKDDRVVVLAGLNQVWALTLGVT